MTNSIHAIEIRPGSVMISGYGLPEKEQVIVQVTDNGKGIATEYIRNVFDPFFTTKKASEGTGLGLSVVYGIIKKHNGSISVESEFGHGTIFTITLPWTKEQ